MVCGIEGGDGLGDVGLGDDDGAEGFEEGDEVGVFGGGVEGEGGETVGCVDAGDVEGVFDGDGEAVEWADGGVGVAEVGVEGAGAGEGLGEERLGEAAGELLGDGGALR